MLVQKLASLGAGRGVFSISIAINKNGIGLGLVIADLITSQFGGKVSVESEFGEGSTFSFFFETNPIKVVESDEVLEDDGKANQISTTLKHTLVRKHDRQMS